MANPLHTSLYEEHQEELSFLYEHWCQALVDWEMDFDDRWDVERRIEANLDGLIVGGDAALDVCRQRAESGDYGELYGSARVLCRSNCADDILSLGKALDWEDDERAQAFANALAHELPTEWAADVAGWLEQVPSRFAGVLGRAAAQRRLPVGNAVGQRAQAEKPQDVEPFLWSLGVMASQGTEMLLYRYMQQPEVEVGRAAAIAALRLGIPRASEYLAQTGARWSWSSVPLALCGDQRIAGQLSVRARREPNPDTLVALGVLGDPGQVELLLSFLSDATLAGSAALALYLITGAGVSEEVAIPLEEDEPPSDEAAAAAPGDGPADVRRGADSAEEEDTRAGQSNDVDDEEPGVDDDLDADDEPPYMVDRIAEDPEVWQAWWNAQRGRFHEGVRYRLGMPFDPSMALSDLVNPRIPLPVRQWLADEIVVRYAVDFPYAPTMLCAEQARLAATVRAEAATRPRTSVGQWEPVRSQT